jgi:hypothetical protein
MRVWCWYQRPANDLMTLIAVLVLRAGPSNWRCSYWSSEIIFRLRDEVVRIIEDADIADVGQTEFAPPVGFSSDTERYRAALRPIPNRLTCSGVCTRQAHAIVSCIRHSQQPLLVTTARRQIAVTVRVQGNPAGRQPHPARQALDPRMQQRTVGLDPEDSVLAAIRHDELFSTSMKTPRRGEACHTVLRSTVSNCMRALLVSAM